MCRIHDDDDGSYNYDYHAATQKIQQQRIPGRKRALIRKYGKAIVLSTTLLYGPMATMPSIGRHHTLGSRAHAASPAMIATSTPVSGSDYKFKDFKDIKGKISLAPGANVQQYEEVLAKVEVEGEKAFEELKTGDVAALTIGESSDVLGETSSTITGGKSRTKKKSQKNGSDTKSQVSDWEADEFGFEEGDDDDFDSGVFSLGSGSSTTTKKGKLSPSKSKQSDGSGGKGRGGGDVLLTDKMAYNNYKAPMAKEEKDKVIKKLAFYSIFPVFVITTVRGQIKAYKEKKWVKKGLALVEEERQRYLEEKKKKKDGKDDDDDDDDDDDNDDGDDDCDDDGDD